MIRPAFVLLAVVFGASGGTASSVAIWVAILLVSVLVHELGHAAAMRAFGFSPSIELHAMGGLTAWSREKAPTPRQRLIVTACGPGAGLVLGGMVVLLNLSLGPTSSPLVHYAIRQAIWVNLAWSLVNLLPVLPWDGGLIVDSAVEVFWKRPVPKVAAISSVAVGAAVIAFAVLNREFLMLIYFGGLGVWQGYSRLASKKPDEQSLNQVWALMQAQRFEDAEHLAVTQATSSSDLSERARLYEVVAWSRLLREDWRGVDGAIGKMGGFKPSRHLAATLAAHLGRHEEVVTLLTPLPIVPVELALRVDALIALKRYEQGVTDACDLLAKSDPKQQRLAQLIAAKLFDAGAWEPALQISLTAFSALKAPVHLVNAACAQTKLGQLDEALETLARAIGAGLEDRKQLLEDPDLAPLRSLPRWQTIVGLA